MMEVGRTDKNRISAPVWDTGGVDPVIVEKIAWNPAPDSLIVRRLRMRVPELTARKAPAARLKG